MEAGNYVILAVDDFKSNITILEEILVGNGYTIIPALDGKEALQKLKEHDIDLILLDILMPGLSGYDVCKAVKEDPEYCDIPIIFITTKYEEKDIIQGFEVGAQDFITKPFRSSELVARVKTQMDLHQSKLKLKELNNSLELKVVEKTAELSEAMQHLEVTHEELKKAHDEILKLDVAKMEFLKIISHEIRTPLNGIFGFSELISKFDLPEEYSSYVTILKESGRRLEEFSNDALLISQLQLNKIEINPSRFSFLPVLNDEINRLKEIYHWKNYEFSYSIDAGIDVFFDNFLFRNLIYNVLENSIKYCNQPGKIWIDIEQKDNLLTQLTIKDNGTGFSDNILNKGGQLFISEHYDRNPGLGLAIVKLIVRQHNGKLALLNSEKGGAVVSITLNNLITNAN